MFEARVVRRQRGVGQLHGLKEYSPREQTGHRHHDQPHLFIASFIFLVRFPIVLFSGSFVRRGHSSFVPLHMLVI
jgi:hypothetical protein